MNATFQYHEHFIEFTSLQVEHTDCHLMQELFKILNTYCYDSSYAFMLIAMLMTMLMTIVDRSLLDYRIVLRSTLFRVSLCSSESYR